MPLLNNDRIQELALVVGDKVSLVNKRLWYALAIAFIFAIPGYYLIRTGFSLLIFRGYKGPDITYSPVPKQPLQISAKGILDLGGNNYSGYIKIKNIEYDWGVANQKYTAEFKTFGGTVLATIPGSTFVLPSSEKLVIFSKFKNNQKPDEMVVSLGPTKFIRKPDVQIDLGLERVNLQNTSTGLIVSAAIKNQTPYLIKQVNLPVAVYNSKNEIVGVDFTYLNDLVSGETRTFQYSWPFPVPGARRAEIGKEVNIFDRNVLGLTGGVSPLDNVPQ